MAFRVTYATLAAESDEVHRAFDAGLAELEPLLGATHGSIIGGEERSTGAEIAERSPVDTDVLVARFVEATAAEVAEAVGAAKAFAPTWAATPWPERVRLLDGRRRPDLGAPQPDLGRADHGGGKEPARVARGRGGDGGPDPLLHQPAQRARRVRAAHGAAQPGRGHLRRHAALRDVGRRHPVQLPGGPVRRAGGRGAGGRQHRGGQAASPGSLDDVADHALPARRRPAAGCAPRRRGWRRGRAGPRGRPSHRRHHLHRLVRGRHATPPGGGRPLPAAGHLRDGGQEPRHRQPAGRPRPGRGGHGAIGVRPVGPEVLRRLTGLRRAARGGRVHRAPGRAGPRHEARRPPPSATPTWARSSTRPPSIGTSEPSPRPRPTGRCWPGATG